MKNIFMKYSAGFLAVVLTVACLAIGQVWGSETPNRVKTVLMIGSKEATEINIQALRDAADILHQTRPDLSAEILKAADYTAR